MRLNRELELVDGGADRHTLSCAVPRKRMREEIVMADMAHSNLIMRLGKKRLLRRKPGWPVEGSRRLEVAGHRDGRMTF